MSPHILYTAGYLDCTPARLKAAAEKLGAVVVDIRFSPRSWHRPEWSRKQLSALLEERYCWEQRLGNQNYRLDDAPISIADAEGGAAAVAELLRSQPVILLCACHHVNVRRCHRSPVSNYIAFKYDCEVYHLGPGDLAKPDEVKPSPAPPKSNQLSLFSLAF